MTKYVAVLTNCNVVVAKWIQFLQKYLIIFYKQQLNLSIRF